MPSSPQRPRACKHSNPPAPRRTLSYVYQRRRRKRRRWRRGDGGVGREQPGGASASHHYTEKVLEELKSLCIRRVWSALLRMHYCATLPDLWNIMKLKRAAICTVKRRPDCAAGKKNNLWIMSRSVIVFFLISTWSRLTRSTSFCYSWWKPRAQQHDYTWQKGRHTEVAQVHIQIKTKTWHFYHSWTFYCLKVQNKQSCVPFHYFF